MLFIDYKNKVDFEYDIQGIIRSFYPGEETVTNREERRGESRLLIACDFSDDKMSLILYEGNNKIDEAVFETAKDLNGAYDRKETKNILKRKLYDLFSGYTKKELLWGTLSGIRPTKITSALLESGMKKDAAIEYMKENYYLSEVKAAECVNISETELEILKKVDYENTYSLYVGIPFCPSTCLYCSFTSYPQGSYKNKIEGYLDALCKEIEAVSDMLKDKEIATIYVGGGTPTTLEPYQLERLLDCICNVYDVSRLSEFTVEAGRPDSITREKLEVIKKYGVTRISINPQTMKEETLKVIGRHHTVEQFKNAYALAREVGFDNINMDFILGLPGEDKSDVENSMNEVLKMKPDSLTIHSLAVKRAARLNIFRDKYKDYTFTNSEEIMEVTQNAAAKLGLLPYYLYRQKNMTGNLENVGYAKRGKEGIYNILIMEEKQTIAACGAGASTKVVFPGGERIERVENVKDVDLYIERIDEMIDRKRKYFCV